jgi:hypothetical protein
VFEGFTAKINAILWSEEVVPDGWSPNRLPKYSELAINAMPTAGKTKRTELRRKKKMRNVVPQMIVPPKMKGRLRPQRERDLNEHETPMRITYETTKKKTRRNKEMNATNEPVADDTNDGLNNEPFSKRRGVSLMEKKR